MTWVAHRMPGYYYFEYLDAPGTNILYAAIVKKNQTDLVYTAFFCTFVNGAAQQFHSFLNARQWIAENAQQ